MSHLATELTKRVERRKRPRGIGLDAALSRRDVETIRTRQLEADHPPCFRTEFRFLCKDGSCEWRDECLRLVAIWKRDAIG